MKILTVVYNLNKGGTQRAAQNFAEAYKRIGHDSRILALYNLGSRYDEIKDHLKVWHKISDKNLQEIQLWQPEIIHIHSHGSREGDINRILDVLQRSRTKVVEQNVFSIPSPWAERLDCSFQLSNWALWLYNMRGGSRFKTAIVPYPVNCDKFYPRNAAEVQEFKNTHTIPKDALVIGRIGQSSCGKWSGMLIDSFNKLAKDHLNLYLVVINPPASILEEIGRSPFKDRIRHIPKIYGDDALSVAYSSLDLMVHIAEQGESFGYVLAESVLCGTPVVTLSTPWGDNSQCEVVGNSQGGYVVNNLNGVVRAIKHYINDPEKDKLKASGYQHIKGNYDYVEVAQKAINIVLSTPSGAEIKPDTARSKINIILKDTFDKTDALTIWFVKTNIFRLRIFTLYRYSMKTLLSIILKKLYLSKEKDL